MVTTDSVQTKKRKKKEIQFLKTYFMFQRRKKFIQVLNEIDEMMMHFDFCVNWSLPHNKRD